MLLLWLFKDPELTRLAPAVPDEDRFRLLSLDGAVVRLEIILVGEVGTIFAVKEGGATGLRCRFPLIMGLVVFSLPSLKPEKINQINVRIKISVQGWPQF